MKRLSAVVPDEEYRRAKRLVKADAAGSIAQLVRDAVTEYFDKLDAGKLLNLKDVPLEQALRINSTLTHINHTTEDSMEGPRAFIEKRKPVYKGK